MNCFELLRKIPQFFSSGASGRECLQSTERVSPPDSGEDYLLVGLGNPGMEYAGTRHNAGWQAVDLLLRKMPAEKAGWQPEKGMLYCHADSSTGRRLYLLKPTTYMNCSGEAVKEVMQHLSLSPGKILVICDCLDLPVGRLRLRRSGSSGGQRGVESIITCLGTKDFPRLRIGIGRPEPGTCSIADYVLGNWVAADLPQREAVFDKAVQTAECWFAEGLEKAVGFCGGFKADVKEKKEVGDSKIG